MRPPHFILSFETAQKIADIPDDKTVGKLYRAMLLYAKDGVDEFPDMYLWRKAKAEIDEYARIMEGRALYGCKGEYHPNWKGGVTPSNQVGRASGRYKAWRTEVFRRDNFTCAICGQVGGKLNAHHIKHWAINEDARFDVDNGITLCEECHKAIHRRK